INARSAELVKNAADRVGDIANLYTQLAWLVSNDVGSDGRFVPPPNTQKQIDQGVEAEDRGFFVRYDLWETEDKNKRSDGTCLPPGRAQAAIDGYLAHEDQDEGWKTQDKNLRRQLSDAGADLIEYLNLLDKIAPGPGIDEQVARARDAIVTNPAARLAI